MSDGQFITSIYHSQVTGVVNVAAIHIMNKIMLHKTSLQTKMSMSNYFCRYISIDITAKQYNFHLLLSSACYDGNAGEDTADFTCGPCPPELAGDGTNCYGNIDIFKLSCAETFI